MMRKQFLMMLLFTTLCCQLSAQKSESGSPTNEIGVRLGGSFGHFKDENYSPLNHQIDGTAATLYYNLQTKNNRLFFCDLGLDVGSISSDASTYFDFTRAVFDLQAGYLFSVPIRGKWQVYTGPYLYTHLDLVVYKDFLATTFFNHSGIGIASKATRKIGQKNSFSIMLQLPLAANLVRPPYSGWDKFMVEHEEQLGSILYRGKLASVNEFFAPVISAEAKHQISRHFMISCHYQWQYAKTNTPKTAIILSHQLAISAAYVF